MRKEKAANEISSLESGFLYLLGRALQGSTLGASVNTRIYTADQHKLQQVSAKNVCVFEGDLIASTWDRVRREPFEPRPLLPEDAAWFQSDPGLRWIVRPFVDADETLGHDRGEQLGMHAVTAVRRDGRIVTSFYPRPLGKRLSHKAPWLKILRDAAEAAGGLGDGRILMHDKVILMN